MEKKELFIYLYAIDFLREDSTGLLKLQNACFHFVKESKIDDFEITRFVLSIAERIMLCVDPVNKQL